MEYTDFTEAEKSGKPFYQLKYYDRTVEYSSNITYEYYPTEEEVRSRIAEMEEINEEIFLEMLEIFGRFGVTEENYKDVYLWNDIIDNKDLGKLTPYENHLFRYRKDKVGYCHINIYFRDLEAELSEYPEDDYEEVGPYGGAFADEDDYWRWKEGGI